MFALGDYMGVKCHASIGGTNVREDQRILESGVHVVVGTPGRVNDMIQRHSLRNLFFNYFPREIFLGNHRRDCCKTNTFLETSSIKMFVLDEADEMLSRGFKDQIYEVFKCMPTDVQVKINAF